MIVSNSYFPFCSQFSMYQGNQGYSAILCHERERNVNFHYFQAIRQSLQSYIKFSFIPGFIFLHAICGQTLIIYIDINSLLDFNLKELCTITWERKLQENVLQNKNHAVYVNQSIIVSSNVLICIYKSEADCAVNVTFQCNYCELFANR